VINKKEEIIAGANEFWHLRGKWCHTYVLRLQKLDVEVTKGGDAWPVTTSIAEADLHAGLLEKLEDLNLHVTCREETKEKLDEGLRRGKQTVAFRRS
jgi:hypothetical protein